MCHQFLLNHIVKIGQMPPVYREHVHSENIARAPVNKWLEMYL